MTVGAIILAAGLSRRMGADKLAADLGGRPVLAHVIDAVEAAGLPSLLASPPRDGEGDHPQNGGGGSLRSHRLVSSPRHCLRRPPSPSRGGEILVPDHVLGIGHSIAAAIRAVPDDWAVALICLGDMPFVAPATLIALAAEAQEDRIIAPTHDGRRGNPLAWGRAFFPALAELRGDMGGRALLGEAGDRFSLLPVDDPGTLFDIDTPEALAEAQSRLERCSK